ncbi:xanthine dehydrogenase family protein molybdopterin-binding subunit, partial [bacterium]|nr:xanthine dehydrogenase family protein molybdopterin-binding subunit [bacterium]
MVKRIDAYEKVTGKALYADDIFLTKMLYAKPLYAEHPHAKILNIDLSEAKQIEGVIDIITSNDCPGSKQVGGVKKDHYVLAHEKTRYIGDVVAMVAAESYDIACSAVSAIKVNYEVLPNISDPEEALKPGSPKVHEDKENNLTEHFKLRHGDMEIGWKNSTKTFEAEFKTQWVEHAYMEPESCVAIKNPDGSVTVYGGMQHPFSTRRYTSEFLGLPLNKVQIIQTTLGGGFGGKDDTASVVCARAALLALRTERPVKLTLTREESMLESYKRHPFKVKLKIGVDNDNKIQALDSYIVADGGPYCAVSPFVIWRPTVQCTGPYIVPNVTCDSYAVYTTNPLCGAMRGFGTPQYNFAVESFIDHVAHQLNIDPIKFRRNNFFKQDCEIATGQKLTNHTVSIIQVVEETLKKFNWDEKYQKCSKGQASDN